MFRSILIMTLSLLALPTFAGAQQTSPTTSLFKKLHQVIGTPIRDNSGNQGTIKNFVVTRSGSLNAYAPLNYVAVDFNGTTYLVSTFDMKVTPHNTSLRIGQSDLRSMPTLQNVALPSQITSKHPTAVLATSLENKTVVGPDGKTIGRVQAIMLNLPNKNIEYLAVSPSGQNGKLYAVPPGDVKKLKNNNNQIQLIEGQKLFDQLEAFSPNSYPVEPRFNAGYKESPSGIYPMAHNQQVINALKLSMHDEAHAHLIYQTYADLAREQHQYAPARVWDSVSQVELEDHFKSDAKMAGMVQDPIADLHKAIDLETQTIAKYENYQKDARNARDTNVATKLGKLINIEKQNLAMFQKAANEAGKTSRATLLVGQHLGPVNVVQITPGKAQAKDKVLKDLKTAEKISAYEYGLCTLYGRKAESSAYPYLGKLFYRAAQVEKDQVFPTEAIMAGLNPNINDDLAITVGAEREADARYTAQGQLAESAGEPGVSKQLWTNGNDESHHGDDFRALLENRTVSNTAFPAGEPIR